jgi:hypothetical protein
MCLRMLSLLVLLPLLATPSTIRAAEVDEPPQATEDTNDRVRSLFREAYAAYNAKNYEESRDLLSQAWAVRQTYDIASALAQSEMKLRQYREAVVHLQYCLDNVPPSTSAKTLEAIKQTFDEAKSHVGTLHIMTDEGVALSLDGQDIGVAPFSSPLFVEPGSHELVFKRGSDSVTKTVQVDAGADESLEVPVVHVEPPPPPRAVPPPKARPVTPAPPKQDPRLRGVLIPAIVDGAVFTIGLTMAVGFRLAANSNDSHAEQLRNSVGSSGCAPGMPPDPVCADLMETAKSKDRERSWSAVGFVVSAVALAAVPVYWYWPRPNTGRTDTAGRMRVGGSIGPGYSGLSIGAGF